MVRVGGGWDTLENYLNKHDPCRYYVDHQHVNSSVNGNSFCCSSEESNSCSSIGKFICIFNANEAILSVSLPLFVFANTNILNKYQTL
jgi:hypothetical protein